MRYARCYHQGRETWGLVEGDFIRVIEGSPFQHWRLTEEKIPLAGASLLPPCTPSKIVCVALNYRDHARELGMALPGEPLLFFKPPSAVIGPGQKIVYPRCSHQVDYEGELAVIIKEKARCVAEAEADSRILGYTCGNDVTARDFQRKDGQWTRAKSFDTFCPLGPFLAVGLNSRSLDIKVTVNGKIRQDSSTKEMIFSVAQLVSYISTIMTLYPGDVIMTGTPFGVGPLQVGDLVSVEIEGIGVLTNEVIAEESKNFVDKTSGSAKI
ncbi:MAG: fumarylacetoacetate hydrolase family protein [Firmicutes bacterium]|nr:fumarylacetoacetate hydrolase family protein [Bacillota bacterium]